MPSRVSGGAFDRALELGCDRGEVVVAQDVERGAVGGEGQPLHHVGDGPLVQGGGEEQLAQHVATGLGPEVALLARVDGGGEEVAGQPPGAVECLGICQGVPPHLAGGVGDLLRVHRPDPPHRAAGVEGGGEGVVGRFVRGQQHGTGGVEDGGDRERGGLARARGHDGDGDILEPHTDLMSGALEVAEEDARVAGRDVLGVLQARSQRAGLTGHGLGHQRLDVRPLGHAGDALRAPPAGLVALVEGDGGDPEGE